MSKRGSQELARVSKLIKGEFRIGEIIEVSIRECTKMISRSKLSNAKTPQMGRERRGT